MPAILVPFTHITGINPTRNGSISTVTVALVSSRRNQSRY